jgi:hypothetical protein
MNKEKLFLELQEYVESNLSIVVYDMCKSEVLESKMMPYDLDDFIENKRKPTLNQVLFEFIDNKGAKDSDIYKKAGLDRRHFSKIRSNPDYRPKKNTTLALALALELSLEETDKLLSSAGYALSESETSDLVVQFCLERKIYDLDFVNQALDHYTLKPLSGVK